MSVSTLNNVAGISYLLPDGVSSLCGGAVRASLTAEYSTLHPSILALPDISELFIFFHSPPLPVCLRLLMLLCDKFSGL